MSGAGTDSSIFSVLVASNSNSLVVGPTRVFRYRSLPRLTGRVATAIDEWYMHSSRATRYEITTGQESATNRTSR